MKKLLLNFDNPWASLNCFAIFNIILTLIVILQHRNLSLSSPSPWHMLFCFFINILLLMLWFRDSRRETLVDNNDNKLHNRKVAMLLFLIREAFFFLSFFWIFIRTALVPELRFWPPTNLSIPSFIGAPSLNTILLVASRATVTLSHYERYIKNSFSPLWLFITLTLSSLFIMIQYLEYQTLTFNFTSGVGGSIFFLTTGFHGTHVILGSLGLIGCLILMGTKFYTYNSILSYELTIWYWHFVDAIWLILYTIFYCWGH